MRKRIFVLVFVAAFAVGLAWAQNEHGQKMDVDSHVAKMKAELNLNDQQADKVKSMFEDIHKRKMALKAQTTDKNSPETREQFQKLSDEQDTRLKEILTPEQFTKYQQLKAEHAAKEHSEHKKQPQ
jgi:Spy/CpxP family protein refolding chaperone